MNKKILISVFCYNVGEFIFDVLEKIYSSSHQDTSIITINDFSKDNTISEIYRFIEKHKSKNIEIISNEKNMGYGYNYKFSFGTASTPNLEVYSRPVGVDVVSNFQRFLLFFLCLLIIF